MAMMPARWLPLCALVLLQITYPLLGGRARAVVVVATVLLGYLISVAHALTTRGRRAAIALVATTTGGGLLVETVGVATGVPFGSYVYGQALGPSVFGVAAVVPLAWTWMAWPAWLAAGHLTSGAPGTSGGPGLRPTARVVAARVVVARVVVAGVGLAAWDLFLDPQMVAEHYWRWTGSPLVTLPGVAGIPISNYLGWLGVAVVMMAVLARVGGPGLRAVERRADAPMLAFYLWTYYSSVLAHAVFLGLPASALWGGLGMGPVAIALTVKLARR